MNLPGVLKNHKRDLLHVHYSMNINHGQKSLVPKHYDDLFYGTFDYPQLKYSPQLCQNFYLLQLKNQHLIL